MNVVDNPICQDYVNSHLFYIFMCVCAQSCLSLCNPLDCCLPGSSVHGILQERILKWIPIPSPRGLPDSGIEALSPALVGRLFTSEPPRKPRETVNLHQMFHRIYQYILLSLLHDCFLYCVHFAYKLTESILYPQYVLVFIFRFSIRLFV